MAFIRIHDSSSFVSFSILLLILIASNTTLQVVRKKCDKQTLEVPKTIPYPCKNQSESCCTCKPSPDEDQIFICSFETFENIFDGIFSSLKLNKEIDLVSYFELFSASTCVGISTYSFGATYSEFGRQLLSQPSKIWYGAPMGFHAIYMSSLTISEHVLISKPYLWYTIIVITTCLTISAYAIYLLRMTTRRFKNVNDEKLVHPEKSKMALLYRGVTTVEENLLRCENSHTNSTKDKRNNKPVGDQEVKVVPTPKKEDTNQSLFPEYNKMMEIAQKLYDDDSSCQHQSHLKIWCRAFANSLNEDVEVHFDRTLFKTAKKSEIDLYGGDGNNFEKRCKEHHQKLRVVTFKHAYEAMEGWQKYGHDFPLEESRSLILSVAAKWMVVVQECIAKEETKGKIEGMGPDDEQKAWFRKAVVRQQELNLNGMKEGSGSKLMFDKWILMGITFGSFGGKMMMKLIQQR